MCEFLKRFLACLEPIIGDLDSRKEELDKLNNDLADIKDFFVYIEGDIKKIGKYHNQKLIHQILSNLNSDVSEYDGMVYLIEADNSSIQKLPQYQKAVQYMYDIFRYFDVYFSNLTKLCANLDDEYKYKSLAKKYYDLFQNDNMYLNDNNVFVDFLLKLNISKEDKRDILCYVIKMNVDYYNSNLNENIEIDKQQDLRKIQEIIYANRGLLNNEYASFVEQVEKQVNLSLPIERIVNHDILEKININNLLLAKTIYLTNKISQNYKSCEFGLVSKYIKEYDELMVVKEKIKDEKDQNKIIKIIKGGY